MTAPTATTAPAEPVTIARIRALDQAGHSPRAIAQQLRLPIFQLGPVLALTDEDLTARHAAGQSIADISAATGIRQTLLQRLLTNEDESPAPSPVPAAAEPKQADAATMNMIRLYTEGQTLREITEATGTSFNVVRRILLDAGVPLRPASRRPTMNEETARAVVDAYTAGHSIRATAEKLGIGRALVYDALKAAGVTFRPPSRHPVVTAEEKARMVVARKAGQPIARIAEKTGRSRHTVKRALSKTPPPRPIDLEAARLYEQGLSLTQIAERAGITGVAIHGRLVRARVSLRRPGGHMPPPAKQAQILAAYTEGETLRSITVRFRVGSSTIFKIVDAAGVPRRRAHPAEK
ncbi:helix-turn-helix domain-containing protein [Streptosporangium sp. NPDC000563]|uniref:helix-turn-helix domain-containing protein n=1 Tax=Streptosporangium sp. NPDC000563 TaxID=3154366 RepID=UPI00332F6363